MTDERAPDDQNSGDERGFKQVVARYSEIAFVLPAATFVGWFIGAELDKHLHTDWLYLLGLALGTIAGFTDLLRLLLRENK